MLINKNIYNYNAYQLFDIYLSSIIVIVIVIVIFIWWNPFIPSRNLDEVFTYNHIWL